MTARYIDIHIVQTVPFANLNRDELNSPKTLTYGGGTRTRVSSQCWKRAVRMLMQHKLGETANRTHRIPSKVAEHLQERGWPEDLARHAGAQVLASAADDGLALDDDGDASVLLFLPDTAFTELADLCERHRDELAATLGAAPAKTKGKGKKDAQAKPLPGEEVNAILASRNGMINLFGRMLAEIPGAKVDGAVQVAHAFTTHEAEPELDFFTAVDDLTELAGEVGAGHMGDAEFSAGVFYRYASVNVADLLKNLNGDEAAARDLVSAFIDAFIESLPEAKKNSTAPFTVPDLAYVAVRTDRPVSLAAAFEQPVRPANEGGCAEPSRRRLGSYAERVFKLVGENGIAHHAHAAIDEKPVTALGEKAISFRDLTAGAVGVAFAGQA